MLTNGESQQVLLGGRVEIKKLLQKEKKNQTNGNFRTWFPGYRAAEKVGERPQGLDPTSEGKKGKRTEARARGTSEHPQRARRPWGSVFLAQSNPRVNQILLALPLAGGSLGLPGAHLLVAWGLLPQSTRAPPCGATAPVWKTDLRPREHILTNGSRLAHLLATMNIGQRTSHPLFRRPFK